VTGVVVTGMHRSGTSLLARLLAGGGLHPGEQLLTGADEEYFEDASFVALHRHWLAECLPPGDGHADWGVSSGGEPRAAHLRGATAAARGFCERRDHERGRWLAKDPRAALFLDVWREVPDLHFVVVYRSPWDVVDSGLRLGHPQFCAQPGLLRHAWLLHNRRILEAVGAERDRFTLVSAEALAAQPGAVWSAVHEAVSLDGEMDPSLLDPHRMRTRPRGHPIADLTAVLHPELLELLQALDALADVPPPRSEERSSPPRAAPPAGGSMADRAAVQVVIPCRDDGAFLDESVASVHVAMQACPGVPTELTIVDDGSTDPETLRALRVLHENGYHVVTIDGQGLSAARNAAAATSRSLAVLPLDADNRMLPALLEGVALVVAGTADVVHGPWQEFGMRSRVVEPPHASVASLLPVNTIDACAVVRRSVLEAAGGFDRALPFMEDWDLWLGAVQRGARFVRLGQPTFRYLVRPGSLVTQVWHDHDVRDAAVRRIVARHFGAQAEPLVHAVQAYLRATGPVQVALDVHEAARLRQRVAALEAELAEVRARRSYRAIDGLTRWLHRRPRLAAAARRVLRGRPEAAGPLDNPTRPGSD
jgi:hypothetical protein